jgi:hypothetical protein
LDDLIAAVELEVNSRRRVEDLLNLLAYTKHKDCYILLLKYLESGEKMSKLGATTIEFDFNQYAMEYLAKYLDDFPSKANSFGYSKEEIDMVSKFLRKKLGIKKNDGTD